MKVIKQLFLLLLSIFLSLGVCGCMEKNYESKISEIKEVIEERYNEEFSVVYFQPALDETYDNVLSLSNKDGVVFNAYQKDGYEVDDNYYESLINAKLTTYVKDSLNLSSNLDVIMLGLVQHGSILTEEFVKNYVPSTSDKIFIKVIAVVVVNDEIAKNKEELFDIYNEVLKFDPKVIEFEVISVSEMGEKLSKVINNPMGYYTNHWDEFKEIESYLDISSKNITSADELVEGVK